MTHPAEESLDPISWAELRAHGHIALDELFGWLETLRDRPAWQPVPAEVREALRAPLPLQGEGIEGSWEAFRRLVLPYPWGNVHPRFWGWVNGTGSPSGALAELATAVINTNAGGGHQIAPYVEGQVVDWCKAMLGFPAGASGVLVTGGSVANLVALAAARDAADPLITERGVAATAPLVFYASSETHNSVAKAVRLLGLGRDGLRDIPVGPDFRIELSALTEAIAADRRAGRRPCCVIGNAGTVNTGTIDDLVALEALCRREGLWFHVDGAFGALAALSDSLRPLVQGMERADSIAFDLHKWMYFPYDVGCVLVRDPEAHRRPFATQGASYLARLERGAAPTDHDPGSLGPELSREFRGLKVWMLLKEHGIAKYARLIEQNVAQAAYLAARVQRDAELELLAPVPLNIVCLRYAGPGSQGERADAVNREVLMRLQERGIAVPSATVLGGRFAIRVAITNHRTVRSDLDLFADQVVAIGREVVGGAG